MNPTLVGYGSAPCGKVLIDLNAQVDVDGRVPADVAMDWLVKEGFVSRD
ncbi:hypothetical protein [Kribbella pratensis]|nr:hypothetical protein [Kribbella pratensis]